jgi:hypothetical protein
MLQNIRKRYVGNVYPTKEDEIKITHIDDNMVVWVDGELTYYEFDKIRQTIQEEIEEYFGVEVQIRTMAKIYYWVHNNDPLKNPNYLSQVLSERLSTFEWIYPKYHVNIYLTNLSMEETRRYGTYRVKLELHINRERLEYSYIHHDEATHLSQCIAYDRCKTYSIEEYEDALKRFQLAYERVVDNNVEDMVERILEIIG